jgi:hypothetical protein
MAALTALRPDFRAQSLLPNFVVRHSMQGLAVQIGIGK